MANLQSQNTKFSANITLPHLLPFILTQDVHINYAYTVHIPMVSAVRFLAMNSMEEKIVQNDFACIVTIWNYRILR